MALQDQTTLAPEILGEFGAMLGQFDYLAPFVVLLLCGVGLPLPEEVTLIWSGMAVYRGDVEYVPITLVCSAAILLGDSIPFWLGKRYGLGVLKIRGVSRILHPERFNRIREKFDRYGNWATFAFRFFAGIRIPGYFISGTMGMSYWRFLLLDGLGVLISVPISIYLGMLFGDEINKLQERKEDLFPIIAVRRALPALDPADPQPAFAAPPPSLRKLRGSRPQRARPEGRGHALSSPHGGVASGPWGDRLIAPNSARGGAPEGVRTVAAARVVGATESGTWR